MRIGETALIGINLKRGKKNMAGINNTPDTNDVSPVFPPAATPVAPSAALAMEQHPKTGAMVVATALAKKDFGNLFLSGNILSCDPTP